MLSELAAIAIIEAFRTRSSELFHPVGNPVIISVK
jgi:hypothetical protein